MEQSRCVTKCITITKKQEDFLKDERVFKLSNFVQDKLDEYIKLRKEYKKFMEHEI